MGTGFTVKSITIPSGAGTIAVGGGAFTLTNSGTTTFASIDRLPPVPGFWGRKGAGGIPARESSAPLLC